MVREALVGPRIVLPSEVVVDKAVLVRDGRIEAVVPESQLPSDIPVRDLGPGILTAGLVDIHTHGGGGSSFNDTSPGAARRSLRALLKAGVTTALPTLATAAIEDLERALQMLDGLAGEANLPRTPGAHLEGPYFSYQQRGAQDPAHLRKPLDGSLERLLAQARMIRMMSFAPELPGSVELTKRLVGAGVIAAAGHSDGREEDLLACQRAGLTHVIHIFSGQSTVVRKGPWRNPGLLEATLASDDLTVEMIADGKHLPPSLMRMAHRCLGDRLCLVSDSTPGAGMPNGFRYRVGGIECVVESGVGVTEDRKAFCGSTTFLAEMIPLAMSSLGIDLPEALAMASTIPARAAGLDDIGRIAPGAHADLALFSEGMNVRAVALGGRWLSQGEISL